MQGKDGFMGPPLVKRLTVRSGMHPDSGAPAHLAILHVGPSMPAPGKGGGMQHSSSVMLPITPHYCAILS